MSPSLLLRLNNELIANVLQLIVPRDVLSVALACRFLGEVAAPHLKRHRELAARYAQLYLGYKAEVSHLESPISYLDKIVRDPAMMYYPQVLHLLEYNDEHDMAEEEGEEFFAEREREETIVLQREGFRDLIERCPYIVPDEYDDWAGALRDKGDDDAAMALLLTLLPNLKEVVLWLLARDFPLTAKVATRITQDPAGPSDKAHALHRLESFRFGRRGSNEGDDFFFLLPPFALVPTVNHIASTDIQLTFYDAGSAWPTPRPASNVQTLVFERATISPRAVIDLLSGITALRTFFYEVDGHMPGDAIFAPDEFAAALIRHAAHSLEQLHLIAEPWWSVVEPWTHLPSLRPLAKLRAVELDADMLCRGPAGEGVAADALPLVDMLPPALEELALRYLAVEEAEVLFEEFAARQKTALPRLKRLVLRHPGHGYDRVERILEIVHAACEGSGVEVQVDSDYGEFPMYPAIMSANVVVRPAICDEYPRIWD